MTRSAAKRANRFARIVAAKIAPDMGGATVAFDATAARDCARNYGFATHILQEANWLFVAEILNRRMPKRFPGKARSFNPYPSPQMHYLTEYRPPNPDPGRPRREQATDDRHIARVPANEE